MTPTAKFFQFSSESMRRRLELAFAVVMTAAATVGLASVIKPDPSKLSSSSIAIPTSPRERFDRPSPRPPTNPPPKVDPAFAAAVEASDIATMEKLFTKGMALDGMLFIAAGTGNESVVRWLLDHGADVHESYNSADAPLLQADDHPAIVALLVERGAPMPSLANAAHAGAANIVSDLIAKHADVNPSTGAPPLREAISSGRATTAKKTRIVEVLLKAGADPNHPSIDPDDEIPKRPLSTAVRSCAPQVDQDETANATVAECLPVIDVLVKGGARADGDTLTAALLVDESVLDRVLVHLEPGATATSLASPAITPPLSVTKKLIAKGVDWGWHDGEVDEALPLLAAVERRDRDSVTMFLDAGAPVNRQFKNGKCALGQAIEGVDGDSTGDAARIVERLIARGADVNLRLPDGRTPLYAAAQHGDIRIIHALLDAGARVNDFVLFETALDAAENSGQIPAARILQAHGGVRTRANSAQFR